ncbi:MAG: hypothetical protein GY765_04830, partial [bacterium]|nr:hypothetical protein [bacterium]
VVVSGTNLGDGTDISSVTLCGIAATILSQTADGVTVLSAAGSAGTGNVVVVSASRGATALVNGFTYNAAGIVVSVSPSFGPTAGGTTVTISGSNLGNGTDITSVTLCGTAASILSQTVDAVTVLSGAATAGTGDVVITSTSIGTTTLAGGYSYNTAGAITSVTPDSGPVAGGTTVTITGTNLGDGTDISSVTLCGGPATIISQSTTQVVVTTAGGQQGTGNVTVESISTGVSEALDAFSYFDTPTVVTTPVTVFTATTANVGGDVTDNGNSSVLSRGISWSENPNPTTNNKVIPCGDGTGVFSNQITGFSPGQTYYVRAYAVNAAGTAYGDEITFTTGIVPVISGTVTDGINPIYGASITFSHDGHTLETNIRGEFSYSVPAGTTTTVTPSDANVTNWSPPNITISGLDRDIHIEFESIPDTPAIEGNISFNGTGLENVDIVITNNPATKSLPGGTYYTTVPFGWSGTLTPQLSGFTFHPPLRTYGNVVSNQGDQDFEAFAMGPIISGIIESDDGGGGIPGVKVKFTKGGGQTTTNLYGEYMHVVPFNWSGKVKPQLARTSFSPRSRSYNSVNSNRENQDFTATAKTRPKIKGILKDDNGNPIPGVTVRIEDQGTAKASTDAESSFTTQTNSNGRFVGAGNIPIDGNAEGDTPAWSGQVTFSKALYDFSQSTLEYTDVTGDTLEVETEGRPQTPGISGTITDASGYAVPRARVTFSNRGGTTVTDAHGRYFQALPTAWQGTVTPMKTDTTFSPAGRTYDILTADIEDQDYITALSTASVDSISVTAPAAGSTWDTGAQMAISWTTTGNVGGIAVELLKGGTRLALLIPGTANDGSEPWTVLSNLSPGTDYQVRLISTTDDRVTAESGNFSISDTAARLDVDRDVLKFKSKENITTGSQQFRIVNTGGGTLNWTVTAAASAHWLDVSAASGSGNALVDVGVDAASLSSGTYTETLSVTDTATPASPRTITVTLDVSTGDDTPPFGYVDTPVDGSVVSGTLAVSGWALDDVQVEEIKIYRQDAETGLRSYIGDAFAIEDARPDIEMLYGDYPFNYKAGWGYMMLTHLLPDGGNGTYILAVTATDGNGVESDIGLRTISCDNAGSPLPFGTIDTPVPGETVSGAGYRNNGWVLTPMPNAIPTDGSTIGVYVDGVFIGKPTYNLRRGDTAELFPAYANSSGAGGRFMMDTRQFQNGLHTIHWVAMDNAGNQSSIGSRYFRIDNGSLGKAGLRAAEPESRASGCHGDVNKIPVDRVHPVSMTKGYDPEKKTLYPGENGTISIELHQLQRLVLCPTADTKHVTSPYHRVGEELRPIPAGSTYDHEKNTFHWQPGPGFFGTYRLEFITKDENNRNTRKSILIKINR